MWSYLLIFSGISWIQPNILDNIFQSPHASFMFVSVYTVYFCLVVLVIWFKVTTQNICGMTATDLRVCLIHGWLQDCSWKHTHVHVYILLVFVVTRHFTSSTHPWNISSITIVTGGLSIRACNSVQFENSWNLPPILKIVTCTAQLCVDCKAREWVFYF